MSVCGYCGVEVALTKAEKLVHVEDIPDGVPPGHEVVAVPEADFRRGAELRFTLKGAAEDMLIHHAMLCPASTCQWAQVLQRALKQS